MVAWLPWAPKLAFLASASFLSSHSPSPVHRHFRNTGNTKDTMTSRNTHDTRDTISATSNPRTDSHRQNSESSHPPTMPRKPTLRSLSSTLSESSQRTNGSLQSRSQEIMSRLGNPLTDEELDDVVFSIQNILPAADVTTTTTTTTIGNDMTFNNSNHDENDDSNDDSNGNSNDIRKEFPVDELRSLLREVAHLSHKDWNVTGKNAQRLGKLLLPDGMIHSSAAQQLLERILVQGNWQGAVNHAHNHPTALSWAVLVTGVNGIRKTTSMYQAWFPQLLAEALIPPPTVTQTTTMDDLSLLPSGNNAFFRQLDHIICTLCNEDFAILYALTSELLQGDTQQEPSPEIIQQYSDLKAAIFTRYRTLSELLGACLLTEAQTLGVNCMMETSGRDVAMFHYVDHFFPSSTSYRKLALHFTINDLSHAKTSVDQRMIQEIKTGMQAIQNESVFDVVYSNAGGPYGSNVLAGVQADSERVWNDIVLQNDGVGQDWYKATIQINAHETEPWTAQAVKPDGSLGTKFTFTR